MPKTHRNVNASYRLDQAEFLTELAGKDKGEMSQFLRKLLDASPEFQEWRDMQCA